MHERLLSNETCPDLADLLLASEGELAGPPFMSVRDHLRRCASCRERVRETTTLAQEYEEFVCETVPVPTGDAASGTSPYEMFRARIRREAAVAFSSPVPRRARRSLFPITAAICITVGGLLYSSWSTPTIRAEELLSEVVSHQRATLPSVVRRVEIRLKHARSQSGTARALPGIRTDAPITRDVGGLAFVGAQKLTEPEEALATLMAAHHFDLRDPLNATNFQDWRASLSYKRDEVLLRQEHNLIALKTTTDEGELRSAELVVRQSDYHPVRQTWTFETLGEVEVVEVASWVGTLARIAPPTPPPSSAPRVQSGPDQGALESAELDARRVLHDSGADLDGHIDVRRSTSRVEVRGEITPERRLDVKKRLGAIDLVLPVLRSESTLPAPVIPEPTEAELLAAAGLRPAETPDAANANPEGGAPPSASGASHVGLGLWRARTFARTEEAERFTRTLIQGVERVRARAAAYEALATRYGEREVESLSPTSQKKLQALVEAHHRDLIRDVISVDDQFGLLLRSSTRAFPEQTLGEDWRSHAKQASMAAKDLSDALDRLLREDDLPSQMETPATSESDALTDVRGAIDRLCQLFEAPVGR